jgi:O-antigen ligase/polysaccharide polymerase Wzy-like membrane protein
MNALPWIAAALVGSSTVFLLWRGTIVLALLLVASQFLGWVDPERLEIAGAFDVHAAIMIIVAVAIAFGLTRGLVRGLNFGMPMAVLATLWLVSLLAPVLRHESTLWLAINASKEFMTLFAYYAVVLFLRSERDLRQGWSAMILVGMYYCVIEILAQFLGPSLLNRMAVDYRQDAFGLWKVYLGFWPVILVLLLHSVFEYGQGRRAALLPMLLGFAGLLLTFFRSYLLATLVVLGLLLLLVRAARQSPRAITELSVVGVLGIGVAMLVAGKSFMDVSDSFMFSGVRELSEQSGGALGGRRAYTEMLLHLTELRPLFGFGFLERDSELVQSLSLPIMKASLGFVDAGWADVLVKFGYVGGTVLLLTFLWIFKRALSLARRTESAIVRVRALTAAAMILVYIIVLPVHAPLTFSFGLLPLALVLGIVDGEARSES